MRNTIMGMGHSAQLKLRLVALTAPAFVMATFFGGGLASAVTSTNYDTFGDASIVQPGNNSANAAQATTTGTNQYGGVDFKVPTGVTTLSSLSNLSTDYMLTTGDCGLGSPRFVAEVTTPTGTENVFFYLGPAPNYTGCTPNTWLNTGNLASSSNLVDATQLGGGFYESYADVQAAYGSYPVTDVYLVADGSSQTVRFDNTQVNENLYTYEAPVTKDSCKDNGWKTMKDANGGSFKNQGQCVSYMNHHDGVGADDSHYVQHAATRH